jgi:death-on-curing protein
VNEPLFLTKEEVLAYHAQQLALFGGQSGLGDEGLLESALVQPQNTYLYDRAADLLDLAAGYAFHIAKNHPFQDGNKRTALQAALGFLAVNQVEILAAPDELYESMIRLTTSQWDKERFAGFLRSHSRTVER